MTKKILELDAKNVLIEYGGANNQILEWKQKYLNLKNFKLTRSQCDYVLKYHNITPKVAKKYINIVPSFGEKIREDRLLPKVPLKIWCEKLLCESEKAYHIWGRILDTEKNHSFWLPKGAILQEEKKLNYEVDYSKYSKRPPLPHQKIAIEKLLANNKFILADDMGVGKAEPNINLLFTPKGRKKMGEIVVGDEVIGSDGKPTKVTGVFPQGKKETFKVHFNDGYFVVVSDEHLWSVSSPNYGKNRKNERRKKTLVLSTKQMYEGGKIKINGDGYNKDKEYEIETYYKSPNGNNKWQIPIVEPIQFENNYELPINPYLLGLMLGDGHITNSSCVFNVHKDDYDELFNEFKINENKQKDNKRKGNIYIGKSLSDLKLSNTRSHNKFIPDIYKYTSVENRLAILQGLMDTDGHCMLSKKEEFHGTEFSTISEKLCDDVCEIVQTLGGIARKTSRRGFYKKDGKRVECNISYRVNIKLPKGMNPFRLKRKSERYNEPKKYPTGRYITNIEKYDESECTCISVDSPDKLYVTEHCIVTHNTTSAVIASLESNAKKILIVCPASLKINWSREIQNYTDRKILIVEGGKWGSTFDFYIINYDIVKNYHSIDSEDENGVKYLENVGFDLAIVDEAHYLSNTTANRTKLMNDLLEKIPKVWLLTGTPMTSRPINYYNLLKIVESPVTLNWQHYVYRYCKGYQFKVGKRKIWNTSGASNLDELRERTKNIVLRRMKTDILDLPDKIITPIFLELNNTSTYNSELDDFIKISNENKKDENITITLNRLSNVRKIIAQEKVSYTCELIDRFIEQDKKVIVFTNYTSTLNEIHEKYSKISVTLEGKTPKNKRQENVDKFQTDSKIKIFISNIVAGGVGITLTEAEAVIMNDLAFVPALHSQAEDRAFRYGQKKNVLVYYPIFENTIEMIIYNILNKKKNIIDQVMGDGEYSENFGKELIQSIL